MEKFSYVPKTKLSNLPGAPGVYALASRRAVLYIGKAQNIRDRVKSHFQKTSWRDSLFVDEITKAGYIKTDSDIDALILESKLIKENQPKYNVMWKDDKKYFFVALTKDKLPRVFLTHQPAAAAKKGKAEYIGPFTEGRAIKKVLGMLRRAFPYYTARTHGPRPCGWCHLNLCPGPEPDAKHYKENLKNLTAVLKGKRSSVAKALEREMRRASANQDFERAKELRDQVLSLQRIVATSRLLSHKGEELNWDLVQGELQKLLNTRGKISRIEAYDISNFQGKEATGSQVTFVRGAPAKEHYRKYRIRAGDTPNDFAMMEELIRRRLSHREWPYPQLMVIDGGKGQLSSALKALGKKETLRLTALAKKHNELFFPGKPKPVLLKDLPQPLENLFLHIRDEAHRFALTYHRKLRSRALTAH